MKHEAIKLIFSRHRELYHGPEHQEYFEHELRPDIEDDEELDFEKPLATPVYDQDVHRHMIGLRDSWSGRGKSENAIFGFATEAERIDVHNQRAKRRGKAGTLREAEWLAIKIAFGGQCAYCEAGERIVLEHVRPIALGGDTVIANVVPACWVCNKAKGLASVDEWLGEKRASSFRERWRVALAKACDMFEAEGSA